MRDKILVVDDVEINRVLLTEILQDEFQILEAEDGGQALEILEKQNDQISVVLLDLIMPNMDGFAVLEGMKSRGWMGKIPVLVISGESSAKIEGRCFEYGVSDFIRKPFDNSLVRKRVMNTVNLYLYKNHLEDTVAKQTETLKKQNERLKRQAERLKASNERIIDILGTVVECRNLESGEHIMRVKEFTRILALKMMENYPEYGLTPEKVEIITSASSLHDVGKIAIPDGILLKPGRLTAEEFEIMKTHTTKGSELLTNIKGIWDEVYAQVCYEICRHHHEKYDGRGYPDGLKGDEIPVAAQIVSIADVYDALVSSRVYKGAFTVDVAFQMINDGECGVFSPKLLDSFARVREEFESLVERNRAAQEA